MNRAEDALAEGRFKDAFSILSQAHPSGPEALATHASFLSSVSHYLGDAAQARRLATQVLDDAAASASARARAAATLADLEAEADHLGTAIEWSRRAVRAAKDAQDGVLECECQLELLDLVADVHGPELAVPLIRELRLAAARTGSARILASLHLRIARIEATYGSLTSANRHLLAGRRLLDHELDYRLQGLAAGHACILGLMESDFERAILGGRAGDKTQPSLRSREERTGGRQQPQPSVLADREVGGGGAPSSGGLIERP